jgi:hypothetical protein
MSADHSTKYSVENQVNILPDGTGLSTHAEHRYRERTPHDCNVSLLEAYARSERVPHPEVVTTDKSNDAPRRGNVYNHAQEWTIVFVIAPADGSHTNVSEVIVTCVRVCDYEFGPTRAYLHSFGPHGGYE